MKKNAWLTTTIQACHEIVYYFPIVLLWNHYLVLADLAVTVAGMLVCYLLGFALGKYTFVRYLEWFSCLIIAAAVSMAMVGINFSGAALTVLTTFAVIRGFRFRYAPWNLLFSNNAYIGSISVYFVTPLVFMFFPDLQIYSSYLYWAGLYCIIHALFTFNVKQLEMASQNKQVGQSIALNVLRANRIGMGVIVIVLFIVINIDRLLQMVKSWLHRLAEWFNELMSKQKSDQPPIPEEPPADNFPAMNMGEPQEESALAKILDLIFYYAAYVVVFLVAIVIVYLIIVKILIPLISRLISTAKMTRELQVGYSDEEEKLEAPQLGKWFRGLIHRSQHQAEPQDNEQRVRYLYKETLQTAIKRGYEFQKSQTPLEIERNWRELKVKHRLPIRLTALYNKARYGETKITDEEIKKLKDAD
jgi:Na+-transporting methylmalonyl-CoA/oxaloacetate decarboxylase gamma subunit